MDTEKKQDNTVAVNAFNKGMNSDLSFDQVNSEQYIFGLNIRITNNTLIGSEIDSNTTEGIVTPIYAGKNISIIQSIDDYSESVVGIMATASIENEGAIITKIVKNNKYYWSLHKAVFDGDTITLTHLFTSNNETSRDRMSIVINKELNDIIKLYIADGIHPVICVNLNDNILYFNKLSSNVSTYDIEDKLCSNRLFPSNKIQIVKKISGILKTSLVQYTYRLYKKYGQTSCLAPLTNKILIISGSRLSEIGNKENSSTTIGLLLKINIDDVFYEVYDHILIYRLLYISDSETARIELISDAKINSQLIILNDTGIKANDELSIEEFASLSGLTLIPECIEQNQGYMFLGNVTDESLVKLKDEDGNQLIDTRAFLFNKNKKCVYYSDVLYENSKQVSDINDIDGVYLNKYADINYDSFSDSDCKYDTTGNTYGGTGKYISWNFVVKRIPIHTNYGISRNNNSAVTYQQAPGVNSGYGITGIDEKTLYKLGSGSVLTKYTIDSDDYLDAIKLPHIDSFDYNDMLTSSVFRSLKRNEVYRYGIIFYDKYGRRSDTSWIADIRIPTELECPTTVRLYNKYLTYDVNSLYAQSIGIMFNVDMSSLSQYNIVGYEIVRCEKTKEYSSILYQGCISRPVRLQYAQGVVSYEYEDSISLPFNVSTKTFTYNCSNLESNTYVRCNGVIGKIESINDDKTLFVVNTDFNLTSNGTYSVELQDTSKSNQYTVTSNSPYYPLPIITSKHTFTNGYGSDGSDHYFWNSALSDTNCLYLFMNSDMQFDNNGMESYMSDSSVKLLPICYIYGERITKDCNLFLNLNKVGRHMFALSYPNIENKLLLLIDTDEEIKTNRIGKHYKIWYWGNSYLLNPLEYFSTPELLALHPAIWRYYEDNCDLDYEQRQTSDVTNTVNGKENNNIIFFDYNKQISSDYDFSPINIKVVKDTKDIGQLEGFTNVQLSGSDILLVSKAYKGYIDTVGEFEYNNWCSNGVYDLRTTCHDSQTVLDGLDGTDNTEQPSYSVYQPVDAKTACDNDDAQNYFTVCNARVRWIGPGPKCFVMSTEEPLSNSILCETIENYAGTVLCDIKHTAVLFAGLREEDKQYDTYYGFGNFFNTSGSNCVFDGDIYITPCEIVTMYKIYDFNSYWDSLFSSLIMYYIPMESKINTFFDYGMNFLNTHSTNLSLKATTIDGVKSSDRPLHQYNMIYSSNNTSNNVFNAQSLENELYEYKNRICYSENKLNGEYIDNWMIFKAVDFIDTDTRWGEITNLLTAKDTIYYWLTLGFGKLTVNERSLVTDENNNTVQLGQGGVLLRTDYIDTKHGMRSLDYAAINTDSGIIWIDIYNKTIVAAQQGLAASIAELLYVLNVLNKDINSSEGVDRPTIHYDILNNELLCRCLNDNYLLIFNLKLNIATSIYTRDYENIILFNNKIIGIKSNMLAKQYNYLEKDNKVLLSPTQLSFVVNQVPSTTKVFDNQKITTLKRDYNPSFAYNFLNNRDFKFTTDINLSYIGSISKYMITDREGNICYTIPRYNNTKNDSPLYGLRMRGKWMRVDITDNNPQIDFSISHVITKFRLSFS